MKPSVIIIGAGPAGLTAGYLLCKAGMDVTILEGDPEYVGGISKTVNYKGFLFDIGGHRFFSKSKEVNDLWNELLPHDMLDRPRSSRIYYRNQFYAYPLRAMEALWKLGIFTSLSCVLSYFKAKILTQKNPKNFEEWVSNNFGKRLFNIFFKTYTEKVWGMSCKEISADWAAQRIKGLSLWTAIIHAFLPKKQDPQKVTKTLIDSFRYPRKGPGMMWESAAHKIKEMQGQILMGCHVNGLTYKKDEDRWYVSYQDTKGQASILEGTHVISSAPLREVANCIKPSMKSIKNANHLKYRDFILVSLILKDRELFSDNWIYIHDSSIKVGRIQNFKSWSPELVPDPSLCCYGLEYFCFEGDGLWTSSDKDLIELASIELEKLGLAQKKDILDGCVVRQAKAYPVYDEAYTEHVMKIRAEIEKRFPRLYLTGRNGMHKYNNQDHAMMTAMLTVENIIAGKNLYDVWNVNQDAEYHEEGKASAQVSIGSLRMVPSRVT